MRIRGGWMKVYALLQSGCCSNSTFNIEKHAAGMRSIGGRSSHKNFRIVVMVEIARLQPYLGWPHCTYFCFSKIICMWGTSIVNTETENTEVRSSTSFFDTVRPKEIYMRCGSTILCQSRKKLLRSGERSVKCVQKKQKRDPLLGRSWCLPSRMHKGFSWCSTCLKALQSQLCNINRTFVILEPPFARTDRNCMMKMCYSFMTMLVIKWRR